MAEPGPLAPEALCALCDPSQFDFDTTDALDDLDGVLGQERALNSIHFGVRIRNEGYNLYVLGPPGVGKYSTVRRYLKRSGEEAETPHDLCYVNNFTDNSRPRLIRLPAGRGRVFREDMWHLVEELRAAIPATFESEEYQQALKQIESEFDQREQEAFRAFREKTESRQVKLIQRPGEFTFAPIVDGKALDPKGFAELPRDQQQRIEKIIAELQNELEDLLQNRVPQWRRERRDRIRQLNYEYTRHAVGHYVDAVRASYKTYPAVQRHLEALEDDVIDNVGLFSRQDEESAGFNGHDTGPLRRYGVNLLIDNSERRGAPVIYADNPTYTQLIGRIEHQPQMGALVTDFTLIKPGDLHRANGGYLIIDARKLLTQPFSWESLKRALVAGELRIESPGQAYSLISTVSLEPEPVPLELKIVLLGDRLLYYLLQEYDPDFGELFKVAADFEDSLERSDANHQLYARLVATLVRKYQLRPFDREAVAGVIDYSARLAADHARLSMHMRSIADLMQEANFWAEERGSDGVTAADIEQSRREQIERADRVRDRMHDEIRLGVLHIDTEGRRVGQVNGLTVIELGNFRFGLPARITAVTRLGEGEVVNIEREVELSGPIHSKGVFILSSYLGGRYVADQPLSLTASLAFEQSYGGVEGDSASLAELCALLSSLAGLGLRQDIAVTGSVDQYGNVQAVGGVNEKVEGFFNVCRERGLTGEQAVIIPQANVQHLMLNDDLVAAARAGRFRVFAVRHVDEAIGLLAGMAAGEADDKGVFPEETVNRRVQARLAEFTLLRHIFGSQGKDDDKPDIPSLPGTDEKNPRDLT